MQPPFPANTTLEVPLTSIHIGERLRPLDEGTVVALMASHGILGGFLHNVLITVDGRLVCGGHRFEAARRLAAKSGNHPSSATIVVRVLADDPEIIGLAEIHENLVRKNLTVLEEAEHVRIERDLFRAAGTLAPSHRPKAADAHGFITAADHAAAHGWSETKLRDYLRIARIDPAVLDLLRPTAWADRVTPLTALASLRPEQHLDVARLLIEGTADSVAEALSILDPDVDDQARPAGRALDDGDAVLADDDDDLAAGSDTDDGEYHGDDPGNDDFGAEDFGDDGEDGEGFGDDDRTDDGGTRDMPPSVDELDQRLIDLLGQVLALPSDQRDEALRRFEKLVALAAASGNGSAAMPVGSASAPAPTEPVAQGAGADGADALALPHSVDRQNYEARKDIVKLEERHRPLFLRDLVNVPTEGLQRIRRAGRAGQLGRPFLFVGGPGSGKTSLAWVVCRAALCDAVTEDGEPCGSCPPCRTTVRRDRRDQYQFHLDGQRGITEIGAKSDTNLADIKYAMDQSDFFGRPVIINEADRLLTRVDRLLEHLEHPDRLVKPFVLCTTHFKLLDDEQLVRRFQPHVIVYEPTGWESAMAARLRRVAALEGHPLEAETAERLVRDAGSPSRAMAALEAWLLGR